MKMHHAATDTPLSHERHHEADTQLYGLWLLIARVAWVSLVILTLALFVVILPPYFVQLQTVCTGAACALVQPTSDTSQVIQKLGFSVEGYAAFIFMLTLASTLVSLAVSGMLFWRKSDAWMALLVALAEVAIGTLYVTNALQESHSTWRLLAIVLNIFGNGVIFLLFSLFPDGRFVPRWTRWLAVGWIVWGMFFIFLRDFPFSYVLDSLMWLCGFAGVLVAQIYRYRYVSGPMQRQQTKWVVFCGSMTTVVAIGLRVLVLIAPLLGQSGSFYELASGPVYIFGVLLLSLSIGIAILRYRLWDIDILINRTLVYGLLTSTLALVYFGGVIALQSFLRGLISQANDVAIVGSTLVIAAVFQPLRHRIQAVIDRRFYRSKYDAAHTLAAFSATLRNEVDLQQLREQLAAVVEETMQPTFVSLWLHPLEHERKHRSPWRANPPVSSEGR